MPLLDELRLPRGVAGPLSGGPCTFFSVVADKTTEVPRGAFPGAFHCAGRVDPGETPRRQVLGAWPAVPRGVASISPALRARSARARASRNDQDRGAGDAAAWRRALPGRFFFDTGPACTGHQAARRRRAGECAPHHADRLPLLGGCLTPDPSPSRPLLAAISGAGEVRPTPEPPDTIGPQRGPGRSQSSGTTWGRPGAARSACSAARPSPGGSDALRARGHRPGPWLSAPEPSQDTTQPRQTGTRDAAFISATLETPAAAATSDQE